MPRWVLRTAWLVLAAAALTPIWVARYLPLLDLPNHLASAAIWLHHGDPAWGFGAYQLRISPFPYLLLHGPLVLLGQLVPLLTATKIYISLYLVALPLSAAFVARSLGRSAHLGLLAFPLAYSWPFAMGWLAWCMGLAAALFALGLVIRALQQPGLWRVLVLVPASVGVYLLHILPWVFLGVAAGLAAMLRLRVVALSRIAAVLGALLPSAALAAGEFLSVRDAAMPAADRSGFRATFENLGDIIHLTRGRLIDIDTGLADELALVLLGLSLVLLLASSVRATPEPTPPSPVRPWRQDATLIAWVATAVAAVLFLPVEIHAPFHMWQIGSRYLVVTAALLTLLPRGSIQGRRALALAPAFAAGLLQPLALIPQFRAFDRAVAGFDEITTHIPVGTDTLPAASGDLTPPGSRVRALRMFGQYAQVLRGGYNPYNFSVGFPIAYASERPAPSWMQQDRPSWQLHAVYYDHVLTFRGGPPPPEGAFTKIASAGAWTLWKNTAGKRPPPPGHRNEPNR